METGQRREEEQKGERRLAVIARLSGTGFLLWLLAAAILFTGCRAGRVSSFTPEKKYSLQQVQRDYGIYRYLLEQHHPGLYWYTPKEEMDHYLDLGWSQLKDSMTELQFRKVLIYVTAKINCGHTTVRSSKAWNKYSDTARLGKMFPLSMKVWEDAMVVTANLNRNDAVLKRGTVIRSVNGRNWKEISDSLMQFISGDGANRTGKYQTLSNRGYFGSLYTTVFGLSDKYTIGYLDSTGAERTVVVPVHDPAADTVGRGTRVFRPSSVPKPSKKEFRQQRLNAIRLLKVDTVNHSAMMDLNSFGKNFGLRKFFRRSFHTLREMRISHLIIDVRSNGGGSVSNSTLLTRYLARGPFKVCDTLYAISRGGRYGRFIQNNFWNNLFIRFLTSRRKDGHHHFGYFERHAFRPKKKDHYNGKVYILTGGNSFSATTLFAAAVREQENVVLVGEETGGGAYGNTAWLIPDVTLPETGVRFRLPLFRLVMNKNTPKDGHGVLPEVTALPTVEAVRKNSDFKVEKVMELIRKDQQQ